MQCECCKAGGCRNKSTLVCQHCRARGGHDMRRCSACRASYYCSKECQKKDWKDGQHKLICKEFQKYPEMVRGLISKAEEAAHISLAAVEELNKMAFPAQFALSAAKDFVVQFPDKGVCRSWCDAMNHTVYPNQEGVVMFGQGAKLKELGVGFRLPLQFFHLVTYVGEGRIVFRAGRWEYGAVEGRPPMKTIGTFEGAFPQEPFQTWIERQIKRLSDGSSQLEWTLLQDYVMSEQQPSPPNFGDFYPNFPPS